MATATKPRTAPSAKPDSATNDARAALIAKRDAAKDAFEEKKRLAAEKRLSAKAARERHEYARLLADETQAEKELNEVMHYGGNRVKDANAELKALMPPEIAAAIEGVRVELHDLTFRIGKSFDGRPALGTRDVLLKRRDQLERAEADLNKLALNEADFETRLARILNELHLLAPVNKAPTYRGLATTSHY